MNKYKLPWHRRYNWRKADVIALAAWLVASVLLVTAYYFVVRHQRHVINAELQTIAAEIKIATVDRRVSEAERDRDDAFAILNGTKRAITEGGEHSAKVTWIRRGD